MKQTCKYCGILTSIPCRSDRDVRFYGRDSHASVADAVPDCKRGLAKLDAPKPAAPSSEDAFALPQNGEVSATAAAQQAVAGLQVRSLELRPGDVGQGYIPPVSKTEGVKFDNGKLRFDLLPPDALAVVAAVLTYGAAKYDDRNWELGMDRARLRAARDRHTNARMLGQQEDPETGLPHLAHEAACTLMELALLLRGVGSDTAAEVPESARLLVEGYTVKAIEAGRVAASRKAVQHV
jgi:hypothetical protein